MIPRENAGARGWGNWKAVNAERVWTTGVGRPRRGVAGRGRSVDNPVENRMYGLETREVAFQNPRGFVGGVRAGVALE